MSEPCCPPGQTSCVAATVVRNVCLLLKPNGNAKIRAVRTLTIAADCTQTVAYVADIGLYNPLTGYTQADEIPCGAGEYIPFASPSTGGDATAANQTLELAQLIAINAGIPAALGQTTMANSTSVAIASDQSPIPIKARTAIAWTNVSGTITVGGTSQVLMAANAAREGFEFMNVSSGDLWIMDAAAATLASPSFLVKAGGWYYMATNGVSPSVFQVIGATTGQGYSARQW